MQIQISAEEIFEQYKGQLAELHHDLLLEKLKNRKLVEYIEQHEIAAQGSREPARARQTPRESLPGAPLPPMPPTLLERNTALAENL